MHHSLFIGIDPADGCRSAYCAVDGAGNFLTSGFFEGGLPDELLDLVHPAVQAGHVVTVGIDGARRLLRTPRTWDWSPALRRWTRASPPLGQGRHAEIILRSQALTHSRWSGLSTAATPRELYVATLYADCLGLDGVVVYEVCAQASLAQLDHLAQPFQLPDEEAREGSEPDLLEASCAASTLRDFSRGLGMEIGEGDGLGSIILPRVLASPDAEVLKWPGSLEKVA